MQPLRLGLVGLGNQGMEHLVAALHCKDVRFVCGIDSSLTCQQKAQQILPELQVGSSVASLAGMHLDGLVLALPHHAYDSLWPQLLDLKLPMLKEKPLARTQQEASRQIRQARAAGCHIQVAIQRRHHPSYVFLKKQLQQHPHPVQEINATLHLGFERNPLKSPGWRDNKQMAGGGALLDAGYHLVDLLHYLIGSFDLVSATLWQNQQLLEEQNIDDQVYLLGKTAHSWVSLDAMVYSAKKLEAVTLRTAQDLWQADRQGVWRNGICLLQTDKQWQLAMADQLSAFAGNIRQQHWHQEFIWDQLPAMRLIEDAYRLANRI